MPPYSDLQFLVGDEIGQVCLDPFSVQLKLDRCEMTLEHEIEHRDKSGTSVNYDCVAHSGPPLTLHQLLQVPIIAVDRTEFEFILRFSDDQSLTVRSRLGPYESGIIYFMTDSNEIKDWIVF